MPLDAAETALVTTLLLGTGLPAPRDVAAAVYERTDGIPLHIEELLGALSAEARVDGTAIREAGVPDTIEDAVLVRLARLSPEAQATARAGAVIGRCFVPDVLAGIMDVPPGALEAPLQELVDEFVLDPPGLRGLYDFRHQLLRDALYRTIPASDRRKFHARAGEFGARLEGASEIHASVHYERAGLRREAYDAALAGAREAARLSARREAFELYRRAVENMPDDLDPRRTGGDPDRLCRAGAVDRGARRGRLGGRARGRRLSGARPASPGDRGADARSWTIARREARPLAERQAMLREHWTELAGARRRSRCAGRSRTDRAWPRHRCPRCPRRAGGPASRRRRMAAIADDSATTNGGWSPRWKAGLADVIDGDVQARPGPRRRSRLRGRAPGLGRQRRDRVPGSVVGRGVRPRLPRGGPLDRCGRSLRRFDRAVALRACHAVDPGRRVVGRRRSGRCPEPGAPGHRRQGLPARRLTARWALGYVAMTQGDLDVATAELADALALGESSGEIELILPPLWGLAEVALQAGDPDRAFALCRDALARCAAVGERILLTPFVVTGVRAAQAGRPTCRGRDLAGRCARAAREDPGCRRRGARPWTGAGRAGRRRDRRRAPRARGGGRWLGAPRSLVGGDPGAAGPAPIAWSARTASRRRSALAIGGRRVGRPARFDAARRSGRDAPRMARGHASDDEPWRPLTSREFEVARLIGEGLTNAEIADTLGIAPKTASSHVEHILAKLGASRRAEIATWASHVQARPATPASPEPMEQASAGVASAHRHPLGIDLEPSDADDDRHLHGLHGPRPSSSWPISPRTTTAPGSSRARASTSSCSRSRSRR